MDQDPLKKDSATKTELSPPIISISLEYYLSLACRSFDGFVVVTKEFAVVCKMSDPLESLCHVEDYGNETLIKLYPIDIWRACVERLKKVKEESEKERRGRFANQEALEIHQKQIQRKRDIIAEAKADVMRLYPNALAVFGRGYYDWKKQHEMLEYMVFRALNGENETMRVKFKLEKEMCEEFQLLPADENWRNSIYQGEKDL
jgi:hypothetical protein